MFRNLLASQYQKSIDIRFKPVILLAGKTGAGKSAFADAVTRKEDLRQFGDVRSKSRDVQQSRFWNYNGRDAYFLELPCFDDEPPLDGLILSRITAHLLSIESWHGYVAGLVYLFDFMKSADQGDQQHPGPETSDIEKQLKSLLSILGVDESLFRILVINKYTDAEAASESHRGWIEGIWVQSAKSNAVRVVGVPLGDHPLNIVREAFDSGATLLPPHALAQKESHMEHQIEERNLAIRVVNEIIVGKWLGRKRRFRETTAGREYLKWLKETKRELKKRRNGGELTDHERKLEEEYQRWKRCDFPFDCRCDCKAQLFCSHVSGCSCRACV